MAESMYLGKPMIATAYSGNLEFMNEANSCLIPCTLTPVNTHLYQTKEKCYWAQADIEATAIAMIKIQSYPDDEKLLVHQAQIDIRTHHSPSAMGYAIRKSLLELG